MSKAWSNKILFAAIIFAISFVIGVISVVFIFFGHEKSYEIGPVYVDVITDNKLTLEDISVEYGVAQNSWHGTKPIYYKSQVANTNETVGFAVHRLDKMPSHFYIVVCHPMVKCRFEQIEAKSVMRSGVAEVNFGLMSLVGLDSLLNESKTTKQLSKIGFDRHILDIKNKYIQVLVENNTKIKADKMDKYISYLANICQGIYQEKEATVMCNKIRFERLFKNAQ